jgi:hypothetical protein
LSTNRQNVVSQLSNWEVLQTRSENDSWGTLWQRECSITAFAPGLIYMSQIFARKFVMFGKNELAPQ